MVRAPGNGAGVQIPGTRAARAVTVINLNVAVRHHDSSIKIVVMAARTNVGILSICDSREPLGSEG